MVVKPLARRSAVFLLVPALAAAATAAPSEARPAAHRAFTPGAAGVGDPYFPLAGNGGYDAGHYDLVLDYAPKGGRLTGTATITATATQDLSRFNLDFVGNKVGSVTVNGTAARHTRDGQELTVTPAEGIANGATFTVVVSYSGSPRTLDDPGLGRTGWIPTADGAGTLSQPLGSATWFPVNDHPSDKATLAVTATVPHDLQVVSNGDPGEWEKWRSGSGNGEATYRWRTDKPMAAYLALLAIGKFKIHKGRTPGGIPMVTAVDPAVSKDAEWLPRVTGKVTDWLVKQFGPYPFGSTGGVIDDQSVGYALETQNRPTYPGGADTTLVVHELAHQWFGDSVSLRRWSDIWLNEGFATYAEWMWSEQHGGPTAEQIFQRGYRRPAGDAEWRRPTGNPGRDGLFEFFPVYTRGAMTVHALRTAVGDKAFSEILRTWLADNADGNATTADFVAHAEKVSGRSLDGLFRAWLDKAGKPDQGRIQS